LVETVVMVVKAVLAVKVVPVVMPQLVLMHLPQVAVAVKHEGLVLLVEADLTVLMV
jgi:hypothetical protein